MRVCQIIEPASGGSIRVALDLSRELVAHGDVVNFLYSPLRADEKFYQSKRELPGVKFYPFVIKKAVTLHDLYAGLKLVWFLWRTGPYDVLHAHSSKAGGLARLVGLLFPRMAQVYSPHAFITMSPGGSRIFGHVEHWLSRATDAIIAVSSFEKMHAVQELKIDPNKVVVIPNAVSAPEAVPALSETNRTQIRTRMGLQDNAFVIGFVGRLVEQKNIGRLAAAFKLAVDQNPHLRLVVVGDGDCRYLLERVVSAGGLQDKVKMMGSQDAHAYYAGFDVLACSSDYEGFSLVFLEAMAAGVPIVTTPVGGAQESVVEGKTGFIAPDFSNESLSHLMLKVAALSPEELEAMGTATLAHSKNFTLDIMFNAVYAVYQACVQKRQK